MNILPLMKKMTKVAGPFLLKHVLTKDNIDKATQFGEETLKKGASSLKNIKPPNLERPVEFAKKQSVKLSEHSRKVFKNLSKTTENKIHEQKNRRNPVQMQLLTARLLERALLSPVVRVNREEFLRESFKDTPYLELAIQGDPTDIYTMKTLKKKASSLIKEETQAESLALFAHHLLLKENLDPHTNTRYQRLSFLLYLAQKLGYLFGEKDLFEDTDDVMRPLMALGYLALMTDIKGAVSFFHGLKYSPEHITLNEVRRVSALVGSKLSKQSLGKKARKAFRDLTGVVGDDLSYDTIKPLAKGFRNALIKEVEGKLKHVDAEEIRADLQDEYES